MVQMHYDNPHQMSSNLNFFNPIENRRISQRLYNDSFDLDRTDSSGIRFYLGAQPREHELGYLTVGADSSVLGIVLPPRTDHFIVDSYCPAIATAVRRFLFSFFVLHSND